MKLSNSFSLFATSLLLGISNWASAIDANPMPIKDKQPNGDWVALKIKGDEHFNWQEDAYGYTVIKQAGWYKYAKVDPQGQLQATEYVVGRVNPRQLTLAPGLLPSVDERATASTMYGHQKVLNDAYHLDYKATDLKGVRPHLVVLIRFADHHHKVLPSAANVDELFNGHNGKSGQKGKGVSRKIAPSGSIKQLFKQNSYGQLEINSTVAQWIDLPHPQAYYAKRSRGEDRLKQGVVSALSQLDGLVDFKQFDGNGDGHIDGITFLHSGYGAEWGGTDSEGAYYQDRIWSHQRAFSSQPWFSEEGIQVDDYSIAPVLWGTQGHEMTRVGVIAHEMGHHLGLPDLYGSIENPHDIAFDFMANAWDFQASQHCPGQLSLWSKMQLGWQTPKAIYEHGQYQLRSSNAYPEGYALGEANGKAGFYWLIENRQAKGFDCSMNQSGLLVWQVNSVKPYVDRRGITRTQQLSMVAGKADKVYSQEDNKYGEFSVILDDHIAMNHIVNNDELMSFCLNQCMSAPTGLRVKVKRMLRQGFDVELSWIDNANNETQVIIERCRVVFKNNQTSCQFKPRANVAANATRYKDQVSFGQYRYRIKAVNSNSSSSYSKPAST